jgi:hypothetical protein
MKVWTWLFARRQRKAHERYLLERARHKALEGQDAQGAIRDLAGAPCRSSRSTVRSSAWLGHY